MIQYFPIVTGSLTVLGNINVSGSITTSGSITISGSITSASFATSASNATNAISASYANNLTVAGTLTAQTIVVQTITSSVDYITGSSINGSLSTNTHLFTGSVSISGSSTALNVNSGSLFVSSSGNIGIGLTNPTDLLHLYKSGTVYQTIQTVSGGAGTVYRRSNSPTPDWTIGHGAASANENFEVYTAGTGSFVWTMNGSERMRITSEGLVGIGVSSPNHNLAVNGAVGFYSTTPSQKWHIQYNGSADGLNFVESAIADYRMFIKAGGNVGIGTGTPTERLFVYGSSAMIALQDSNISNPNFCTLKLFAYAQNAYALGVSAATATTATSHIKINGETGNVYNYSNTTTWQTTSDVRVKENINTISNALNTITSLNPVTFDYKQEFADKNGWSENRKLNNIGFIAQEFETVFPKYVHINEDKIGDTAIEDFKSIDTGHLVPVLVKAIQELNTKFEEYKATHP